MSAFENVPQHIKDSVFDEIANELLNNWITDILDEGQYYADMQIAMMSNDETMKQAFNLHYGLTKEDEDYLNV